MRRNIFYAIAVVLLLVAMGCNGSKLSTQNEEPAISPDTQITSTNKPTEEEQAITPTEKPTPAPQPTKVAERNKVLLYAPGLSFEQLAGIAFENGVAFEVVTHHAKLLSGIAAPEVAGVIIATPSYFYDTDDLLDFVNRGGRILFAFDESWTYEQTPNANFRNYVQENFGVRVVEGYVARGRNLDSLNDVLSYDELVRPSWLGNYTIEIRASGMAVRAYLATASKAGELHYVTDMDGQERLIYYANPEQSVSFFPTAITQHAQEPFFADRQINNGDNAEAALAMLRYVSGK